MTNGTSTCGETRPRASAKAGLKLEMKIGWMARSPSPILSNYQAAGLSIASATSTQSAFSPIGVSTPSAHSACVDDCQAKAQCLKWSNSSRAERLRRRRSTASEHR